MRQLLAAWNAAPATRTSVTTRRLRAMDTLGEIKLGTIASGTVRISRYLPAGSASSSAPLSSMSYKIHHELGHACSSIHKQMLAKQTGSDEFAHDFASNSQAEQCDDRASADDRPWQPPA